jgi:hypothetical protein
MTTYVKFGKDGISTEIIVNPAEDFDTTGFDTLQEGFTFQGRLIKETNGDIRAFTAAELKAQEEKVAADLAALDAKRAGVDYELNGKTYKITLTKETQDTVAAITIAIMNNAFNSTVLKMENGVSMPISDKDWMKFASWFAGERNKLFV